MDRDGFVSLLRAPRTIRVAAAAAPMWTGRSPDRSGADEPYFASPTSGGGGDASDEGSDDDDGFPVIAAAEPLAQRHARPWAHTWDEMDFFWATDLRPDESAPPPRKSTLQRGLARATSFFVDGPLQRGSGLAAPDTRRSGAISK